MRLCLPSPAQRLPTRLLRTSARRLHQTHLQGLQRPVSRGQHLFRCRLGHPGCHGRLSVLLGQDQVTVLLSFLARRHPTYLPQCCRWVLPNLQGRGNQGSVSRHGSFNGPDRRRQLRATAHLFLRKEKINATRGHDRWPCSPLTQFHRQWLCRLLCHASSCESWSMFPFLSPAEY